jgi:hypothetical protein
MSDLFGGKIWFLASIRLDRRNFPYTTAMVSLLRQRWGA